MLAMQVLYVDGKAVRQVSVCEHCKRQVTDGAREESYFLHKVEPIMGEQHAEIFFVHADCAVPFIGTRNVPQGRWYLCTFDDWVEHNTAWREVDAAQVMEQLQEVTP